MNSIRTFKYFETIDLKKQPIIAYMRELEERTGSVATGSGPSRTTGTAGHRVPAPMFSRFPENIVDKKASRARARLNHHRKAAALKTAERKVSARLSHRVAILRKSLNLQSMCSMRLQLR